MAAKAAGLALRAELIELWFGDVRRAGYSAQSLMKASSLWFGVGQSKAETAAFDKEMAARFGPSLADAAAGLLDGPVWTKDPEGVLAFCILCDQLSRNIHRGKADAFALDAKVVERVRSAVNERLHTRLHVVERAFVFLPLEHSEQIADHMLAEQLLKEADQTPDLPDHLHTYIGNVAKFLDSHTEVIKRFGRYPHRNRTLGRQSTPDELEYLKTASGWGQ
ncbi:unnamed protein product (mitochondrion) [Plasmodiophora brassicae]|uniref:DUF924 domain-containing protein n=1 Tax=Plasmodiophora brassicae TaxID=37360 RepID=A0A0G4J7H5_PLABS|nr:hypothetical protein PBRA_003237 [Plasmodiophora brassicae]SPQ95712.1 unnamed protein product [Plasmodiophora brassicae]